MIARGLAVVAVAAVFCDFAIPSDVVHIRCLGPAGSIMSSGDEIQVLAYVDRDDLSPEEAKRRGCRAHRYRVQWGMRTILDGAPLPGAPDP